MPNWCSNYVEITFDDTLISPDDILLRNADDKAYTFSLNKILPQTTEWKDILSISWIWGTKWDVDDTTNDITISPWRITISFESAWAPPIPVYEELYAQLKLKDDSVHITACYDEWGVWFFGEWKDGNDDCVDYSGNVFYVNEEDVYVVREEYQELFSHFTECIWPEEALELKHTTKADRKSIKLLQ